MLGLGAVGFLGWGFALWGKMVDAGVFTPTPGFHRGGL